MNYRNSWARCRAKPLGVVLWLVLLTVPVLCEAEGITFRRIALTCDERYFDVCGIAFSPDGSKLASASASGLIQIWDAKNGALLRDIYRFVRKPAYIAFSPESSMVAVGGVRNYRRGGAENPLSGLWGLRVLDSTSGQIRAESWGDWSVAKRFTFAAEGKTVIACRRGGLTSLDLATGRATEILLHPGIRIDDCGIAGSADRLAFFEQDGGLCIYDRNSNEITRPRKKVRAGTITALAFSPDGSCLASGSLDHEVRLWESATARELAVLHEPSLVRDERTFTGCIDRVLDVRFSVDGTTLLSAHVDRVVRFWDRADWRLLTRSKLLLSDDLRITSMTFSPDARSLGVVGFTERPDGDSGDPRMWDIFVCDLPRAQRPR